MEKFIDDKIEHIEDDIGKIQTKPNMYISYLGSKGALHLSKEIINNAIDECINPKSPANIIDIYLNETENRLTVTDNGRGIQFEDMVIACTKLQSGSKFTREASKGSAGENGVGLTCCNALADHFEIVVTRYGEKGRIAFERGELTTPLKPKKIDNKEKHGTSVSMVPSPFFMGVDCGIKGEELIEWLDGIVYLLPSEITINLTVERKGKESIIRKKYHNKNGLYDYVKKLCKKPLLDPIHFMKSMKLKEVIPISELDESGNMVNLNREVDRFIGLEVAFTYNSISTDMVAESFCNFIHTIDNGVHVEAVKTAILQYFTKQVRDGLSERESKSLDIQQKDAEQSLVLSVYLSTDMRPQFASQTKEKLSNNEFFKPLRDMTFRALEEYFRKNPKDLKKMCDNVKLNAKARVEASKVRNAVIRGETSSFDLHKLKNYVPANNKGKSYRELYLIEGDSAMGSARTGRFSNDTQAMFALRGVPLNSFGLKLDKVLLNAEFNSLVRILGCNIGDRFDISKLKFDKIIIMTDADIDGFRIASSLCTFFLVHMPELVKQGFIYKAVTPLYKIKDKKKKFILNKQEYIQVFEERIRESIKVVYPATKVVMNDKDLRDFLMKNRLYLEELTKLADHFALDPVIMEYTVINYDNPNFGRLLNKRFNELRYDDDRVISGIYENKFQTLIVDHILFKRMKALKTLITEVNDNEVYYDIHEKMSDGKYVDLGIKSIGELMLMCAKFQPEIVMRYKGLGELKPAELNETTLDPNNRILIKFTIEDMEREIDKFNILHGDKSEERKQLMTNFTISKEDLDN